MRGTRYLLLPAVIPGAFSALCTPLACSAVHVFLIRGTNDPYPGRQLPTAEGICEDWDCSWSNIEYPAVFNDYCDSVETGIANLGKAVTDYATRCPDAKIVLSGHSQGGQVMGDYLGGGGGNTSSLGCVQQTSKGISPETFPADHSKRISQLCEMLLHVPSDEELIQKSRGSHCSTDVWLSAPQCKSVLQSFGWS